MGIKFCKKCKVLMTPRKEKEKMILLCSKCGKTQDIKPGDLSFREKIKPEKKKGEGVKTEEDEFANFHNICKKCGYGRARIIDLGILYSDEEALVMLQCGKCGYSERISRKAY